MEQYVDNTKDSPKSLVLKKTYFHWGPWTGIWTKKRDNWHKGKKHAKKKEMPKKKDSLS